MDNNLNHKQAESTLSNFQSLSYALPMIFVGFLLQPTQVVLAGAYAKHFGLTLAAISAAVFIARIFDVITDPIIGYLADRYWTRTGTRKPWVSVGGVIMVVSGYFLFSPQENVSIFYFLSWYMAFYLGLTIIDIPHTAWGGELTTCGHAKNKVYSMRLGCIFLGIVLYTALPLLPFFDSEGFSPESIKYSAFICAIAAIPLLYICVKFTPDGRPPLAVSQNESPRLLLNTVLHNKPFIILISGYALYAFGGGMFIGLLFTYADAYLDQGNNLPLILTITNFFGFMAAGVVFKLPRKLEKPKIYAVMAILSSIVMIAIAFLKPGEGVVLPFTLLLSAYTFCNGAINIVVPSMMSDISDYGTWKFGVNRGATYFSCYSLLLKTAFGIGMSISLAMASWFNFDPTSTVHSEHSVIGLLTAMLFAPAVLILLSSVLMSLFPINSHKHRVIQRRLAMRRKRCQDEREKHFAALESPA